MPNLTDHLASFLTAERIVRIDEVLSQRTKHLCLVLEDIYQPHNAAACLRSCDCFGLQDVYIIENKNQFEPSEHVSMGAEKWVDTHRYNTENAQNTGACMDDLRNKGYQIAALTLRENSIPIDKLPLDKKVALTIGTELTGLSEDAHQAADHFVHLPMRGFTQSYNLSVCAALTLQILRNRLETECTDWHLSPEEKNEIKHRWIKRSIKNVDKLIDEFESQRSAD